MGFFVSVYLLAKIFVVGHQNTFFLIRPGNNFVVADPARLIIHRIYVVPLFPQLTRT